MLEDPVLGHFVAALECAIEKREDKARQVNERVGSSNAAQ
jgi:hypothetical protein